MRRNEQSCGLGGRKELVGDNEWCFVGDGEAVSGSIRFAEFLKKKAVT